MELMDKMSFHIKLFNCTECIVKYSFLVHKSITCLDLSLHEYSMFKHKRINEMRFPDAQTEISYNYVCTKEGFQKSLQPFQTQLLHSLHLDLCIGRQRIVRDFIDDRYMVNEARFHDYITIYEVKLQPYLYEMLLNGFIGNAIRNNVDVKKVPVIEMYLRLMKDEQFCRYSTFSSLRRPFFDILHQECSDSHLIVNILKVFNFEMWIISDNFPEQVEFFLHHVHVLRKGNEILKTDMINVCLAESLYKNAEVLFKYQAAPIISRRSYEQTVFRLRGKRMDIPIEGLEYPTENGSGRINCFLAMQTFLVFLSNSVPGSQALKLLWRSIPTRFLTFDEFKDIYGRMLTPREIEDVYNFYRDIIGRDVPVCHPRMLKHLCRLTIRAVLGENEHLPEGIGDLGLPQRIQSYLKLQK